MSYTFRPIAGPEELNLYCRLPYVLDAELADDLAAGRRRAEWLWMAIDEDGDVVARAAWWARAGAGTPLLMDAFECRPGRYGVGAALVDAALHEIVPAGAKPPEYIRFVPPGWRDAPDGVEALMGALGTLGARPLVERRRLEWRAGTAIPQGSGRLEFRGFRGTEEALDLMTEVLEGTLDVHSRADLERLPPRAVAAEHLDGELRRYPSPPDWWRVATLPGGEPVGFVFPARNDYGPIIAYIGVLPAHRGHGYIADVLAEGTRVLAEQGPAAVPRIRATTDVGNVPMAEAFLRAGYVNYQNEINMAW